MADPAERVDASDPQRHGPEELSPGDAPHADAVGRRGGAPGYDPSKERYAGISAGALGHIDDVRAARDFAEMIVDTVREGLLILDLDLRVQAANESFYQTFGVDPEDTVGRLVYELGNGQWDLQELHELLEGILPHEKTFNDYEVDHAFEGIGRRQMLLNARRLDDHEMILLAIEDVTKRRRVKGRAERQLDTFGAALGAFEDFVYVLTPDVRFTYANRALLDLWGLELEDVVGKGFAELGYPPELVALHGRQVDEVVATRQPVHGENAYVSPTGQAGYYEYIFSPVLGEGGAVEAIAGVTRDVTERRRAIETLRQAATEATFRTALADALRPLTDPAEVQAKAARLLGEHLGASRVHYAVMESDGEHAHIARDSARAAPDLRGHYRMADFATLHAEARAGRRFVAADVAADARLSDDEKAALAALPVAALVVVPLVKGNRLVAVLAVHHAEPHAWTDDEVALIEEVAERTWADVERAHAEAALRELNATLERRVEERTKQVRELSRALALAEQAERRRIAHVLHDDLQQVLFGAKVASSLSDAEQLEAVLDEALELTRSLSHSLSPPFLEGEDFEDLLRWVAERQRMRHGLEIEVEVGGDVPVPEAALRVLLYQSVRELLFNIAKHSGVKQARLVATRTDHHVQLVVEDEGAGFDPAKLEEPSNTGLGLPSVRERLELVGGTFEVESAPGAGTRVTITVPVGEGS